MMKEFASSFLLITSLLFFLLGAIGVFYTFSFTYAIIPTLPLLLLGSVCLFLSKWWKPA
ncbi:hypothetical protein H9649_06885 [Sporosarcina sp. Sa2YVA2]|uniref:Uncharacterized protein n=1 Tax=Sporosarcina quadrami TaxID=2762234 RepID=A0ABR8U8D5_9BACL|nr:hypothetical protein [Sporosarcina quadrami]MBD7984297.1 hypothetical protein [Sporosarcina quadrami]